MDLGSGDPGSGKTYSGSRIQDQDPGVKKAPDPGSGSTILLEGHDFKLWTDHRPLVTALNRHQPTTAYHPQAKSMVERLHCLLKDTLRAHGATSTWAAELPWVLLGLRSTS